ncbi:MAG: chromate efflux transporter [Elusimicrobia bacterium]|nr:chromate efflux transporter [Elusimicrobiota bacterium]
MREIFWVFSKLGATAFGGPFAVAHIEREVVEKRGWVSSSWFAGALGMMEIVPGPTATEMAIYCGYMRAGLWGGFLAGLCYTYPSFLMMLVLAGIYFGYGVVPSVSAFFNGISPAVVAVLIHAAYRMARGSIGNAGHLFLFCLGFVVCYYLKAPVLLALLMGGVLGMLWEKMPRWGLGILLSGGQALLPIYFLISPLPGPSLAIPWPKLGLLFLHMLKIGSLVFGGGYVIVPFMAQDFVDKLHWLTPEEFLVGFGLGKATPGPLSITAAFVGYKVAGILGALVGTVGMFFPCFAILLALLPTFERWRTHPSAHGFFRGVEAVTVGAVLAVASGLIQEALSDWSSLGVLVGSLCLLPFLETVWIFVMAGVWGVVK